MTYALWDTATNNLVNTYGSEREALEIVLAGIAQNGPHDTDTLALDVEDEHGEVRLIAYGQALAELARDRLAPAFSGH